MGTGARGLLVAGWVGVIVVAVLMAVVRGRPEYGPAVVFGSLGLAMAIWTWRRGSKAAVVTSLVLGILWTVQFAAYAVAGGLKEAFQADVFAVDLVAVVAGALIVAGSLRQLMERRRAGVGAPA